jgi:hypothetical protein
MMDDRIVRLARVVKAVLPSDANLHAQIDAILAESEPAAIGQEELPLAPPAAPKRRRPMGSSATEPGAG